ncbi:PBP1A family penicillin-binding protein [Achromobacter mucicolens]|jgi:penicillin-binding protein 1A|uniref:Penicillin-binding protein 1A n=1 Tax=Achromobacter mucicolens TaxID=1389922 RepID=A0ABM8L693_9BURK|nr:MULTISPECIES: PBP1A family penicillin-binding protein [Achromobacter]KXJ66840.1 penicillin-binding protein [Achromobacter xylosoxidans]KRB09270.1 penicillin-binding protein [Achromobacter sp. Root170]MCP2514242.1 PBP1A family penicillin-binding protein [Achromobacter mucicolens]MCU6617628.1 PBP1A family penicillin-binding protein [Achromobacter mucicolens]MDF2864618.1 penicillin-binding protein [Achromobacter mucicolens]
MSKPQNSSKKDKPASSGSPILRFFVKTGILFAGLFLCGVLLAGMALALAWPNLPDLNAMTDYRPRVPLRVYTADRVLIGEFGEERRNVLRFNEIPDVMKSAVLAAEDDRFYQHGGIDWMGVVRAGLTNLISMSKTQGASTITMQVARNFYLSSEKTYSRKFYELLLTFKIESELTKDQILELYMNQIYLGHRAYGFAAASRTYFGKPLSEVTPAEAAMLAGIPKAPSRFNPIANRPRAELRQRYVLGRMHSLGYLTEPEYKQAMAQPIVMKSAEGTPAGGYSIHGEYVAELARQLLYNVYQDNVYSRGINIYTTVQSKDQEAAYRAVREGVLEYTRRAPYPGPEEQLDLPPGTENNPAALDEFLDGVFDKFSDSGDLLTAVVLSASPTEVKLARSSREIITVTDKKVLGVVARALNDKAKPEQRIKRGSVVYIRKFGDNWEIINMPSVQAAFVALSPQDGAIRAMVGGFDFYRGNFNRVTQAWRQPGSNIKPFIYAASLERGLTPGTQISDQPFELTAAQTGSKAWNPKNYGNQYEPMLTLRQGLYKSKNMVSIRILQAIGPQYAQDYLTRFGFDKARQPAVLPLALGAGSVTPLQLAGAFSVFANGGYRVTPYLIDRVTDSSGKVIMQSKPVVAGDAAARAIDPRTAWVMDDILRGVTTYGTAARARALLKRGDIAGKTGTTNESVDAWFSGYTPTLAATAWLGFDQPKSLGSRETGGGVAMPIWVDYMQSVLKGVPEEKQRPRPDGLLVENGEFYFSEFPPGQAVARLGLPEADTLGEFLNGLTSGSGEDTRIKVAPGVGTQTATPWSQKIPF